MKIGIDARKLGPYVSYLLRNLLKQKNRNKYVLFFDSRVPRNKTEKYKSKRVEVKYFPFSQYRKFIGYGYSQILVSAFLAKERLNIFHATAGTVPLVYPGKTILNLWKIEKKRAARTLQKKIIKASKKIIVPTETFKKRLIKSYKLKKEDKIIVMSKKPVTKEIIILHKEVGRKKKKK